MPRRPSAGSVHGGKGHRLATVTPRTVGALIVAAVLWQLDRDVPALVVALLAVTLLALGLLAPTTDRRLDSRMHRVGIHVAGGLGTALSTLAWTLLVLPVWALSKLVRYSSLEGGWANVGSAWVRISGDRERSPDGRPSHPNRMGGRDAPPAPTSRRRARLRWAAVLVTVAATLGLGRAISGDDISLLPVAASAGGGTPESRRGSGSPSPTVPDDQVIWDGRPLDDYAHEDEPWARQWFREFLAIDPLHDYILGQRLRDFRGDLVNIVDGRRVSYEAEDPELTVWFFGGSTMFGIGQRDDHTIPSVIARLAEADGVRVRAENFGASGDVNWVETLRFAQALEDEDPPDLVVFYDGTNEDGVGYTKVEDGVLDPEVIDRSPLGQAERDLHRRSYEGAPPPGDESAQMELRTSLSATQYGRGVRVGRRLAGAYDTAVMHFWQPVASTALNHDTDHGLYDRMGHSPDGIQAHEAHYRRIRDLSGVDPIDLSDALDGLDRPVFFDFNHTNELGARIVAQAMYEHLAPQLRELAADR